MTRSRLFTVLSALSLLLCVAMAALWVRTFFTCDHVTYLGRSLVDVDALAGGSVMVDVRTCSGGWLYGGQWRFDSYRLPTAEYIFGPPRSIWNRLGFYEGEEIDGWVDHHMVVIPLWLPVAAAALLPALWLRRHVPLHTPTGHCPSCGYDLRGNMSGVCPECGQPVPAKPEVTTAGERRLEG